MHDIACMMEDDGEKQNHHRILLRPWLEQMLETNSIPGLEWYGEEKTMFQVPWKHRSKKDWSLRDSRVFLEWARNTGRLKEEGGKPDFAQLKTRFRCALNKAPDINEVRALHCDRRDDPFKVYTFKKHNIDSSVRKMTTVAMSSGRKVKSNEEEEGNAFPLNLIEENILSDLSNEEAVDLTENDGAVMHTQTSGGAYSDEVNSSSKSKVANERVTDFKTSTTYNIIPLSVELMSSSSSDDGSAIDHDSPTTTHWPISKPRGSTANSADDVQSIDNLESRKGSTSSYSSSRCRTPLLNNAQLDNSAECLQAASSADHMLQVASLFVEADAQRVQQTTRRTDSRMVIGEPCSSEHQNLIIIKPSDDDDDDAQEAAAAAAVVGSGVEQRFTADRSAMQLSERCNHRRVFAGHEFKQEPIDFTKKDMNKECRTNVDLSKPVVSSLFEQVVEGDSREKLLNFIGEINNEELIFQLSDHAEEIQRKVEQNEQLLMSKVKVLYMWEEHLRNWEAKLKAMEDACFWKNKYLDEKLARSGVFVPESEQHSQLGRVFSHGNRGQQSLSRVTLPVKGIQRDKGVVMHNTSPMLSGIVRSSSQSAAGSELVQPLEQPRTLNDQMNGNVDETIVSLGKVGYKRKRCTVINGDSVFSEEPLVKRRRTKHGSPVNKTETSKIPPQIVNKFDTSSGTMDLARFQNNQAKCAPNQVGKVTYECKPLPSSSNSDAVHPIEEIEIKKTILVGSSVDVSNVSIAVPKKSLQESVKEEIFPSSNLSVSIPSIAYVLPSVSIADNAAGGLLVKKQSTDDSSFSPISRTSGCFSPYTVETEVISDCESDGELIIDSSKSEETNFRKEDDSNSSKQNQNEQFTNVEKISPSKAIDSSEKHSSWNGETLTVSQEKPIHLSPNPRDLKIFQEWLKGVTQSIDKEKSLKSIVDVAIVSDSMKQVSQIDADEDANKNCQSR